MEDGAKECRHPLEVEKGKGTDVLLEPPEGNVDLLTFDFSPLRPC